MIQQNTENETIEPTAVKQNYEPVQVEQRYVRQTKYGEDQIEIRVFFSLIVSVIFQSL